MTTFLKNTTLLMLSLALAATPASAQKNDRKAAGKTRQQTVPAETVRRDPSEAALEVIDRIFNYIDGCTPAAIADGEGRKIEDLSGIDENSSFMKGDFGINTYEWGVTYSGLLLASEVTGDTRYSDYVYERMDLIGSAYPYVRKYYDATGYSMKLGPLNSPKWLDDCGSMTAAMIKATLADPRRSTGFRPLLDNWFNFVMYREYRLGDGILARNRPATNSVWLDDMYMGITPIAYRALLSQKERGDLTEKFFNEAVNQVLLFKKYLWVPEKRLYRHGWVEGMSTHPDYHWARANGWAVLTMCDLLDVLPENFKGRQEVLDLLVSLLEGIAPYQAPDGRWHQLIDKTESYLETSASAMFVYGFAHAINKGWIDRTAYQDIAKAGWAGVTGQVNAQGQVENTCVGTGLGWTNTFYEGRPVSVYAAHGYGPVLLAGAEMLKLYKDSGRPGNGGGRMFPLQAQSSRQEGKPMLFLAGDSTCRNGRGTGDNGQWGWGSFFAEYMNGDIVVENDAVGGLSSRTFFNNNWARLRDNIQPGDFVLIQFGHNDLSPLNTGRARGTLKGTSDEAQTVVMEKNGGPEEVYSYGHYIRMMVRQTLLRGGIPVILSPTPQNSWEAEDSIRRFSGSFNAWCAEVAGEEGVSFIDLNELIAKEYDKIGKSVAQEEYFADSVHTREAGARLYCTVLANALKAAGLPLGEYVKQVTR